MILARTVYAWVSFGFVMVDSTDTASPSRGVLGVCCLIEQIDVAATRGMASSI